MIRNLKSGFLTVFIFSVCLLCYELGNGFRELNMRFGSSVDLIFLIGSTPYFTIPFALDKLLNHSKFLGVLFLLGAIVSLCFEVLTKRYLSLRWIIEFISKLPILMLISFVVTFCIWHLLNYSFLGYYFLYGELGLCNWWYDILKDFTDGNMLPIYCGTQLLVWTITFFSISSKTLNERRERTGSTRHAL